MIHPRSIVHSLVEFVDGSYKAQLGIPDMRLPIQYALTHPQRLPSPARHAPPTDWGELEFLPLDAADYPAFRSVRTAAERGGNRGTVLNAADEVAVASFLGGAIGYTRIAGVIDEALDRWGDDAEPSLSAIGELDDEIRTTLSAELGLVGSA